MCYRDREQHLAEPAEGPLHISRPGVGLAYAQELHAMYEKILV